MAVGDILKEENLIVEVFTVKASEDIELGEIVQNDGNGILAATSADVGPYFMALKAHTYADEDTHTLACVVVGYVDAQAVPSSATVQGRYLEMADTDGAVSIFDYSTGTFGEIVGIAMEAVATTGTAQEMLLGTYP